MRAGIDIGGTFTDVLFYDPGSGIAWKAKVPSSQKPEDAFAEGLNQVLGQAGIQLSDVQSLVHGTTLVTNSLIEGKVAKTGLLVTEGFRDLLEIGRQTRSELYNIQVEKQPSFVPPHLVREIKERIDAGGRSLLSLDTPDGRKKIQELAEEGVEALAVALLFSFINPKHEEQIFSLAKGLFPEHRIFLSSRISPEFREYERMSTTVIAAAVAPKVSSYLENIQKRLKVEGFGKDRIEMMHSGGGTLPLQETLRRPHVLVESGPAAGIMAASQLARKLDLGRVIAFDMGGTTAKAGIILSARPQLTTEYEVGGKVHHGGRIMGGYPIRFPMIDVAECGAGAGSIAWIDPGGHLKVGPQSAGASPGPACYGKGGKNSTVTDAYIALGYLESHSLLGGKMEIFPHLSLEALERNICKPLKIDLEMAALGILTVVNSNMLHILRLVSVSRGHDPRDFVLLAYGGAGPLHAAALAEELSIRKVIIPRFPGIFSALGLLCSDFVVDFSKAVLLSLEKENLKTLNLACNSLFKQAEDWFQRTSVSARDRDISFSCDLRYFSQNYELNIPFPKNSFSSESVKALREKFNRAHHNHYGHYASEEPIQIVNLRLRASKKVKKPGFPEIEKASGFLEKACIGKRDVWVQSGIVKRKKVKCSCRVFKRSALKAGHEVKGPAVIEEEESTTFFGPSWRMAVDSYGNLVLKSQ